MDTKGFTGFAGLTIQTISQIKKEEKDTAGIKEGKKMDKTDIQKEKHMRNETKMGSKQRRKRKKEIIFLINTLFPIKASPPLPLSKPHTGEKLNS